MKRQFYKALITELSINIGVLHGKAIMNKWKSSYVKGISMHLRRDFDFAVEVITTFTNPVIVREFFVDCPTKTIMELMCEILLIAFEEVCKKIDKA